MQAVEDSAGTHHGDETNDRPMSCVPAELHSNHEICQYGRDREVRGLSLSHYYAPFTCLYQVVKRAERHLTLATEARSYLGSQVKTAKEELKRVFGDEVPPIGSSPSACERDMTVHFSFDFAQQVGHTCLHQ